MSEKEALKDFSPTWEGVKSVGMKALKWAAYGAIALGVLAVPFAGGAGLIGGALKAIGIGTEIGFLPAIGSALLKGAMIGGMFGAIKGAADMPEAIEDAKSDKIDSYERGMVARTRAAKLREMEIANMQQAAANEPSLTSGIFGGKNQELAQVR